MAQSEDPKDRDVIEQAKRDPAAFGVLFDRHFDAILGYIFRRTADWSCHRI